ncbi:hypothetical protein B0H17DRAFT_1006841 [Mycena rosella]|uniref:DDE Tnp4 domain-containing protein n=1 Tax=Mycena rosella TaxID=1033263 RepID=A0AAD7DU80_MYCRO|nr:hypothetical protein B0H17DRAFT_1006841 [Mycena rosella]
MLRIRSEHAIGFLKGGFHSLKHLRVNIRDEATHKIATYWVSACIGIHAFALRSEAQERAADIDSDDPDPFIAEGLSSTDDDSEGNGVFAQQGAAGSRTRLSHGKVFREDLKGRLFRAHDRRRARRAARRAEAHGL